MELYARTDTGEVITKEKRDATLNLIKLLYRLEIIDVEQALQVAVLFNVFSV